MTSSEALSLDPSRVCIEKYGRVTRAALVVSSSGGLWSMFVYLGWSLFRHLP